MEYLNCVARCVCCVVLCCRLNMCARKEARITRRCSYRLRLSLYLPPPLFIIIPATTTTIIIIIIFLFVTRMKSMNLREFPEIKDQLMVGNNDGRRLSIDFLCLNWENRERKEEGKRDWNTRDRALVERKTPQAVTSVCDPDFWCYCRWKTAARDPNEET